MKTNALFPLTQSLKGRERERGSEIEKEIEIKRREKEGKTEYSFPII